MKAKKQNHPLGCGVACVAYIVNVSYQYALASFFDGERKAKEIGFTCREIVRTLGAYGLSYGYKYVRGQIRRRIYVPGTIIFIRRSRRYPSGHYLCRVSDRWMDPWRNYPKKPIKPGFRTRPPDKPIYAIMFK